MKRGTPDHPKMKRLTRVLRINRAWSVGILESLWHWAGRFAPQGDIGRYPDGDIAEAVFWPKEPGILIEGLIESEWVDRDTAHRLVIHDWPDHAEESVKKYLKRNKLDFVKSGGFVQTFSGQVQQTAEKVCLPEPVPIPKPKPSVLLQMPPPWNSALCVGVFQEWFAYLTRIGKQPIDPDQSAVAATSLFSCVEELQANMRYAMANEWRTLKAYLGDDWKRQKTSDHSSDDGLKDYTDYGKAGKPQ